MGEPVFGKAAQNFFVGYRLDRARCLRAVFSDNKGCELPLRPERLGLVLGWREVARWLTSGWSVGLVWGAGPLFGAFSDQGD